MQMEDNETPPHEDFKHSTSRHVRARAREMNSSANAQLTGTPPIDVTIDARGLSRAEFEDLKDKMRGGTRAGQRSEAISRQLREERRQRERAAFESAIQNSYRKD